MIVRSAAVQPQPMIEMNTTPLIDVLLVLLVMFIITIPIQSHAVKLDLPRPGPMPKVQNVSNEIEISRSGALLWNGQPVTRGELETAVRAAQQLPQQPELHLRPDADARYGAVDEVLGLIKREQVKRFGFVGNEAYRDW